MKVKQLIELLKHFDGNLQVILAKDGEGNGYSPAYSVDVCGYAAENSWSGEICNEDEIKDLGFKKAILIGPVN